MKSPDVEADIQARKFLEQPNYQTGGPRRRYRAGKVKRYPEEDEGREFEIPERVLRHIGKPNLPQGIGKKMAKGGSLPDLTGDGKITRADVLKGRGVFKHGGHVMKRAYRTGGDVLKEIDEDQKDLNKMSFGAAFKKARANKGAGESFTWRGKTYSTNVKKEGYTRRKLGEEGGETKGGPSRRGGSRTPTVTVSAERDEAPGRRFTGTYGETREALSSLSPEQKKAALAAGVGGAAMLAGGAGSVALRGAGAASRTGEVGMRGMTLAQREKDAAAAADYAKRMKLMKDTAEARARMGRGATYKHGGSVKKYAGGGSVSSASRRADGIAQRGKTKGRMV